MEDSNGMCCAYYAFTYCFTSISREQHGRGLEISCPDRPRSLLTELFMHVYSSQCRKNERQFIQFWDYSLPLSHHDAKHHQTELCFFFKKKPQQNKNTKTLLLLPFSLFCVSFFNARRKQVYSHNFFQ